MLNIILLYKNYNKNEDIINYINHINNINSNIHLNILITVINTNKKNILNKNTLNNCNNINSNININFYNYSCIYNDSIYNEIINLSPFELVLFTDFNIYLSESILEYILLNNLKNTSYIRTSVLELKTIPDIFYKNYNNSDFFNCIPDKLEYINNENLQYIVTPQEYINHMNNNDNTLLHISNDNIKKNNLHYLNNINEFLLIKKEIIIKYGFNITNENPQHTLQYLILNLINNNISMIKLPLILSVYKKTDNYNLLLLDSNLKFNCCTTFSKNIDYKNYDYKSNKEKSIIRSHIKILNGINNNDLKNINKELKNINTELNNKNDEYKIYNTDLKIKYDLLEKKYNENLILLEEKQKVNNILNNKNKELEYTLELFKNKHNILNEKYVNKLKIINTNINNIICNEINNF